MPQVRDPEVRKLYIIPQSLSLCLTGYAWFGQASSISLLKWFVGGLTRSLLLCATVETCPTPKPPASQPQSLPWLVMVAVP
jgi:hypothetical protein